MRGAFLVAFAATLTGCAEEAPSRFFNESDLTRQEPRVMFVKARAGVIDRLQAQVAREGGKLFPEIPPLQ